MTINELGQLSPSQIIYNSLSKIIDKMEDEIMQLCKEMYSQIFIFLDKPENYNGLDDKVDMTKIEAQNKGLKMIIDSLKGHSNYYVPDDHYYFECLATALYELDKNFYGRMSDLTKEGANELKAILDTWRQLTLLEDSISDVVDSVAKITKSPWRSSIACQDRALGQRSGLTTEDWKDQLKKNKYNKDNKMF